MQWKGTPRQEWVNCCCLINPLGSSLSTLAAALGKQEEEWGYEKGGERWDRRRLWIDHRGYPFIFGGYPARDNHCSHTSAPVRCSTLGGNEWGTMEWWETLHKWHFVCYLGKFHQQRLRYSPSCLRFSARTSGNGAEVSNRGPGCDTCCSRTPGTSAHDTGFEHRSPTLAWAEPPLLTWSACRSTPNQSKATNAKSSGTGGKRAPPGASYCREHALRKGRGLWGIPQASRAGGR